MRVGEPATANRVGRNEDTPAVPLAPTRPLRKLTDDGKTYNLLATVENVAFRLVPTVVIVATAATAIRAAIKPYSIAVAPSSFLKGLINFANISKPPLAEAPAPCP